jgi:hypothetical protein
MSKILVVPMTDGVLAFSGRLLVAQEVMDQSYVMENASE